MAYSQAEFRRMAQERYALALETECLGLDAEWRQSREAQFEQHIAKAQENAFWAWLFDLPSCESELKKAS